MAVNLVVIRKVGGVRDGRRSWEGEEVRVGEEGRGREESWEGVGGGREFGEGEKGGRRRVGRGGRGGIENWAPLPRVFHNTTN